MKKLLPVALLLLCLSLRASAGIMEADKPAPAPTPDPPTTQSQPVDETSADESEETPSLYDWLLSLLPD